MTDISAPESTINRRKRLAARVHPIVKLDHLVRIFACPILAMLVVTARTSSGNPIPLPLWIILGIYALVWPHVARFLAQRTKGNIRRAEMRSLVIDSAAAGAGIALASFQLVPTLAIVTGIASILTSVGGVPLLLVGMSAFAASTLITGATVTEFSIATNASPVGIALSALGLFLFQTMMGFLTYRTARSFVQSRRRIAEQADEIQRQNRELFEAREEALQAAQAKAAFLATMSHEIRTPLNGVLGMTSLLADTRMTTEQQDFVRTIQVSGTTLLAVINDILDYSRIESGRLELEDEPLSVRGVVEEALEIVGMRARDNGIELVCEVELDVPELIHGDAIRLRQILTNLAGNAVKFTSEGEVVVTVRSLAAAEKDSPAEMEFSVRDTGIGISADRLPILFIPFSQADASTTRRYGGTGLGLAISKRLTELMGGTITVASREGEGSTFTFTVKAQVAKDRRKRPRISTAEVAGQRVLVVDDNATNRRVLCAHLASWGMKPEAVENAEEAIASLADGEPFVLAILDLHMPDVDGMTLAHRIRDTSRNHELPLILLSSSLVQSKDDPEKLFNARLMKPVRQSKLFDSIVRVLDHTGGAYHHERTEPGLQAVPLTAPMKILVADDNEVNRKVAGLVLRRLGYGAYF
ncbi:MAG TPA: ATP-binding protein, partial [Thermoanaerobaculia bacterium]|nr:ATP-binding protein [Thermoanaerobaculia bacterium]